MNKKRGMVVVLVLVLVLASYGVVGRDPPPSPKTFCEAEYGDCKWLEVEFEGKSNDFDIFGIEPPPENLNWDFNLDLEGFKLNVGEDFEVSFKEVSENFYEKGSYYSNNYYDLTSTNFPGGRHSNTRMFVTWLYLNLDDEARYVKEVSIKRHDDDLTIYRYSENDPDTGWTGKRIYNNGHRNDPVTISYQLFGGWNVIVMIIDDDGGYEQHISYDSEADFFSTDNKIFFMGSSMDLAYQEGYGVPDWASESEICKEQGFNWLDNTQDNNCCGDDGMTDLGNFATDYSGNEYVCLNKENVGVQGSIEDIEWGLEENPCGDWCWVPATGTPKFNIFTIKKTGEEPYDVVSNSERWIDCDEEGTKEISQGIGDIENVDEANQFYCYQEGNRWSWAQCLKDEPPEEGEEVTKEVNVKERFAGDGLFNLPIESEGGHAYIDIEDTFKEYYGDDAYVDFTGYKYLNLMVKPEVIDAYPVNLKIQILGPDPTPYYEGNILGFAVNQPILEEGKWIHVQVPIGNYLGVTRLNFVSSKDTNTFEIKNVYLSRENEKPKLCSGESSFDSQFSAWINNLDYYVEGNQIRGEHICNELYGGNAWLGEEVTNPLRRCCGNDEDEYYAGESKAVDEGGLKYGCWNSLPVASGETVMNVEFDVEYFEEDIELIYPSVGRITVKFLTGGLGVDWEAEKVIDLPFYGGDYTEEISDLGFSVMPDSWDNIEDHLAEKGFYPDREEIIKKGSDFFVNEGVYEGIAVAAISYCKNESLPVSEIIELYNSIAIIVNSEIPDEYDIGNPYFQNSQSARTSDANDILVVPVKDLEINRGKNFKSKTLTYTCTPGFECTYPLPGEPPYTVTNRHLELYELWYMTENGEIPVTAGEIDQPANLKAKKVAQQVIFVNKEDEEGNFEQGFFGCQAASFVGTGAGEDYFTNDFFCSNREGKFCSYSDSKEDYTVINSWSEGWKEDSKIGYREVLEEEKPDLPADLKLFLRDITSKELLLPLNHSTSAFPGQNILPNADFVLDSRKLSFWTIISADSALDVRDRVMEEGKLTLQAGEKLRSERIAVLNYTFYHFSLAQECAYKLTFINKDGHPNVIENVAEADSEDAVAVVVEISGPCEVEQPMLQAIDEFGPADYFFNQDLLNRAGAACCPKTYCWNGYACVEPMNTQTFMVEHVSEGRDYRCIDGEWRHLPVKWDWNAEKWGFCQQQDQCFVLSSGDPDATAASIIEGKIPPCINSDEYVLDHYCEGGNWTGRTKLVANKLLELINGDEYVLYCTDFTKALPSLDNQEQLLGVTLNPEQEGDLFTQPEKYIHNCIDGLPERVNPEDYELIKEEENTCINNVCVLQYKDGFGTKVAFATTLNKPIDDPNSFLTAMNVLAEACPEGEEFVDCEAEHLKYSNKLNAVIYGKEELTSGFVGSIINIFSNMFREEVEDQERFVTEAQNFRELYLLQKGEKKVRAIQEIFPGKETLVAEYENFATPVCDYVDNLRLPEEEQLLETVAEQEEVICTTNESLQKVEAITNLNFLWPQLTGKLRVSVTEQADEE